MGDDFTSLLGYRGINPAIEQIITRLEAGFEPPELTRVVETGAAKDFAFADRNSRVGWYDREDFDTPVVVRPHLPELRYQLGLQSGFFLTFGQDAILLDHLLRWQFFWEDIEWQQVMVPAVNWFRDALGASDAVITWDNSRLVASFHAGKSFERVISEAIEQGEVEVNHPNELCWDEGPAVDGGPIYFRHNRGWWRP